jgi:hypothetical protein
MAEAAVPAETKAAFLRNVLRSTGLIVGTCGYESGGEAQGGVIR